MTTAIVERIKWLDTSRGIAMLMVIYSHLDYCDQGVMRFFAPVFLTTFFFVSGYLFKEGCSFSKVLEQRTRTLLIPFLLLGALQIAMSQTFSFNEHGSLAYDIRGLLFQYKENAILWFFAALYVYSLIFYWIERGCKSDRSLLIVSCLVFLFSCAYRYWLHGPGLPWHLLGFGWGCFYMGIGKWYRHNESRVDALMCKGYCLPLLVVYLLSVWFLHKYISFFGSEYIIDAIFVTFVGLTFIIYFCKYFMNRSRLILFVGANSMLYFAGHGKVFSLLQVILYKVSMGGGRTA